MKYLRKFNTEADYNAFKDSDNYVTPNVVLVNGAVDYNPLVPLPLYIEAIENLTVTFGNTYEYSKNNSTWTSATSSTSISANAGEKVYFRASGLTNPYGIGTFTISNGNCNVGGNIMSMVYGADFEGKTEITQAYQFYNLFNGGTKIVDATKLILPATTLSESCYNNMFYGCKSLINAPELPATKLIKGCYTNMFGNCTSLVTAPALPATTLATYCYTYMFSSCTSLVNAPALPAMSLKNNCYEYMFQHCTSLVNAPELPATTLAKLCYNQMFNGCRSLVNAPVLPATTLANGCYSNMFNRCTNLNYIKAMFTTTPSTDYMNNWAANVASNGTFVKNSAATWENTFGPSAIPNGWTVEAANA